MDTHIIKFIKTLSERDRSFYILMRSYERDITDSIKLNYPHLDQNLSELSLFYENEIIQVLNSTNSMPIYQNQNFHDDKAESSSTDYKAKNQLEKNRVNLLNDEFAEKLGKWASSFSDDENTTLVSELINKDKNSSDLSSGDN